MKQEDILLEDYVDKSVLELSRKYDEYYANADNLHLLETIKKSEKLISIISSPLSSMQLYYDIGTGYGELRKLTDTEEYLEKEIFNLRKSIYIYAEKQNANVFQQNEKIIADYLAAQIYVNLGNALSKTKRYIAAIDNYFYAIIIDPTFSMAYANLSSVLFKYAESQVNTIYKNYLNQAAYYYYKKTKEFKENLHTHDALKNLEQYVQMFSEEYIEFMEDKLIPPVYDFDCQQEIDYRMICSLYRVFLNPVCDVLMDNCFWIDDVQMPFVENKLVPNELSELYELFAQIKSEYAYGRYLWYQAQEDKIETSPFWSNDIDLGICKKFHSDYSYRDYISRAAYRMLYSIFDRIGYFINSYWNIGLRKGQISFKKVFSCVDKNDKSKRVPNQKTLSFKELHPLYWLQKDLSENEFVCITNPNSIKLDRMRNDMEHNVLRTIKQKVEVDVKFTKFSFRSEIEKNTIDILKLLRESIIYLVLAVKEKQENDMKKKEL